jgi:hypothetical protein
MQNSYCDHRNFDSVKPALKTSIQKSSFHMAVEIQGGRPKNEGSHNKRQI